MDTYSSFYKGLFIPALSAVTFTAIKCATINDVTANEISSTDFAVVSEYHCPYFSLVDSTTNKTIDIDKDFLDLMTLKSFADKIVKNISPIEESIQTIIDDYFWEMI